MATVEREIRVPVPDVHRALTTPETYPHWLVGCRDIRAVDEGWPAEGAAFHHRVGLFGPMTVNDSTKVLEHVPDERLSLEVRARPLGRGRATFVLRPGSDPASTTVTLDEVPIGLLAPTAPLAAPLVRRRNQRSLANLADLLERGISRADGPG